MSKPKYTFEIESLVKSVYQSVFGKNVPDEFAETSDSWIENLEKGNVSPEAFVEEVLFSEAVIGRHLSDDEFLKLIYKVMEVKKPTDYDFWRSRFETRSRRGVLHGLFITENWTKFCEKYNLK